MWKRGIIRHDAMTSPETSDELLPLLGIKAQ
jgi:hypothetical protein